MSAEQTYVVTNAKDAMHVYNALASGVAHGALSVVVKPYVENRRRAQENLYRGWCRLVAGHTGNDPEMLHKYFAAKFLGREHTTVHFSWQGKTIEREVDDIKSTTKLNMKEMSAFMTSVQTFCQEHLGLTLPSPDDSDA